MKKLWVLWLSVCLLSQALAKDNVVNISYVKSPFNLQLMVMKEQGLLEKALAKEGVEVRWHEITSGSKQAQAMASGDLDIGGVMNSTSVLLANGAGNPVKIIAGVSRPTDTFALVGANNGATTVAELKGKTVAGPKGTVLHQMLVAALVRENLNIHDVKFLQMGIPAAFAALQSGELDAALLAASTVIAAQKEGASIITTADGLVVPKLVMAASQTFLDEHPQWSAIVVSSHDEAWQWISDNPDAAIALGAKLQDMTLSDAQLLFDWAHFTQRFNQADIASMEADMQFLIDNDMMQQAVDIPSLFWSGSLE